MLTSPCVEWAGGSFLKGYGVVWYRNKNWKAHRLVWTLIHGPIPDGMLVCHRCDNPPCVNPEHLYLGTHLDNQHDKYERGRARFATGERHGRVKLTATQVEEIRELSAAGMSQSAIARRFNVAHATVWRILAGRNWNA